MEFAFVEYEFSESGASGWRRISSLLAENRYHSLAKESAELVGRYVHQNAHAAPPATAAVPRTMDVLIPAGDANARILICERPAPGAAGGFIVAVVAVGRTQEEAHRTRTALKIILDSKAGTEGRRASLNARDSDRAIIRRFRQEWLPALGLERTKGGEREPRSEPWDMAALQALIALKGAPRLLDDRPSVLKSALEQPAGESGAEPSRPAASPDLLDTLMSEGLVDRSYVLVCRESHQIVGIGKDLQEVQAAAQLSLRCPRCRKPMSEEAQDILYALSTKGDEFIVSSRWILEAADSSLRKRGCEAEIAADGAAGKAVHGAASYQGVMLLLRVKDGAPGKDDVQALLRTVDEFEKIAPGVPVRGVYIASRPPSADAKALAGQKCTVVDASRLESDVDRLLATLKRENFIRLTGTTLEIVRPDPTVLLTADSP
jgi:hypothetical protein